MDFNSTPVVLATPVVSKNSTVFNTFEKEVVIEAPSDAINQILCLCNGNRSMEEVVTTLSEDWDQDSVADLLEELLQRRIIVDGRSLEEVFWGVVTNPMRFPRAVSDEDVPRLVSEAVVRHRQITADEYFSAATGPLSEIIRNRKSTRQFSGEPVDLQEIVNMLWSSYAECTTKDGVVHRTTPSAGALYPLLIHVCLMADTDSLCSGVYRICYDSSGSVGFKLVSNDTLRFVRSFMSPLTIQNGAHGVVVVSGSLDVSNEKYGNRSMLLVPLEAGHVAQNTLLEATRQNIATLEIGGFVDRLLSEAIHLPQGYKPITTIVFGKEGSLVGSLDQTSIPHMEWAVPTAGEYDPGFAIASVRLSEGHNWSHGRDPSPEIALRKAISEAREWTSCGSIPKLIRARFDELENAVDPEDVIRFHPEQYHLRGFPFKKFDRTVAYEWVIGTNLEGKELHVLADHVFFPYRPRTPYYCFSNSSGCAAHPDEQEAVEKATLELIERDAFTNAYLSRLDRPIVDRNTLPEHIQGRIRMLNSVGFEINIVDHSLDLAPVVCVFAQNKGLHYTACASCSSFDIEYAISHALMEVEASVLHRLQSGHVYPIKPFEVIWPNDHGRLYEQEQYFNMADFLIESRRTIAFSEIGKDVAQDWAGLLSRFAHKGWEHLIIPLELSEDFGGNGGLSIVRAIVPGMVQMTFGYQQEPAGMERVYEIAERFGSEKLSYEQLTKFPHPFA